MALIYQLTIIPISSFYLDNKLNNLLITLKTQYINTMKMTERNKPKGEYKYHRGVAITIYKPIIAYKGY